jgi:hypothetical protein
VELVIGKEFSGKSMVAGRFCTATKDGIERIYKRSIGQELRFLDFPLNDMALSKEQLAGYRRCLTASEIFPASFKGNIREALPPIEKKVDNVSPQRVQRQVLTSPSWQFQVRKFGQTEPDIEVE